MGNWTVIWPTEKQFHLSQKVLFLNRWKKKPDGQLAYTYMFICKLASKQQMTVIAKTWNNGSSHSSNSYSSFFSGRWEAVSPGNPVIKVLWVYYTTTTTIVLWLFWILSGTTRVSQYQKGKTNLDLLEQEIVSGSGICWVICKSAPHPRQITMPAPHHSVFTGRMPFLPPNQQR